MKPATHTRSGHVALSIFVHVFADIVFKGPPACRYKGELLAQMTQRLYKKLNEPLDKLKREIGLLQHTMQQGGSGSSRKKARDVVCSTPVHPAGPSCLCPCVSPARHCAMLSP